MLPEFFKPILWSYNLKDIDEEKDKKTIIEQAINYGTLEHWCWIAKRYGKEEVKRVLASLPASSLRPQALRLASLLFGTIASHHASRSTH